MTKQSKKPTLADKKASKKGQSQATAPAKPLKAVKPKGPVPTFDKNAKREAARMLQVAAENEKARLKEFAEYVRKERLRLPNMLVGDVGKYYVSGQNSAGNFAGFDFVVKQHWFPSKDDKPGQYILVVQEVIPQCTDDPVFIFHKWLMKNPGKVQFARDHIGVVQAAMLAFLQYNMSEEIREVKASRTEQQLKQKPAELDGIHSMRAVDDDHKAELGTETQVPVPEGRVDVCSMAHVDQQHMKELEIA